MLLGCVLCSRHSHQGCHESFVGTRFSFRPTLNRLSSLTENLLSLYEVLTTLHLDIVHLIQGTVSSFPFGKGTIQEANQIGLPAETTGRVDTLPVSSNLLFITAFAHVPRLASLQIPFLLDLKCYDTIFHNVVP